MTLIQNSSVVTSNVDMNSEETQAKFLAEVAELHLIENIVAGVEQSEMISPSAIYSADLQEKIAELQKTFAQPFENRLNAAQTETNWFEELDEWRKSLVEREQGISAFQLLSYCSKVQPPLEHSSYAALAGFYRKLPATDSVLSKFDYAITQFFSRQANNQRWALRVESQKLVDELNRLNLEWIGKQSDPAPIKSEIRQSILALSKLSLEAKTHQTLQSWNENDFFYYLRESKLNLSKTFFVSEVTAAIVICNLVMSNHFINLSETDAANLDKESDALNNHNDSRDTLSNRMGSSSLISLYASLENNFVESVVQEISTAPFEPIDKKQNQMFTTELAPDKTTSNNSNAIAKETVGHLEMSGNSDSSEALKDYVDLENPAVLTPKRQPENLARALSSHNSIGQPAIVKETVKEIETKLQSPVETARSAKKTNSEITNVLEEVSGSDPNCWLIRKYLQKSDAVQIRELRFEDFLDFDGKLEDKTLLNVLQLIIRAEETIRTITSHEGDLSAKIQDEVKLLNEEIQQVVDLLRRSMTNLSNGGSQINYPDNLFETLLCATSTLAETQVRLNSVIAPHQKTTVKVQYQLVNDEPFELNKHQKNGQNTTVYKKINLGNSPFVDAPQVILPDKPESSKWLMVAVACIVLLGCTWFIINRRSAATPFTIQGASANARLLDSRLLLGGAKLVNARVSNNTLLCSVGNEWDLQSQEQKEDNLKLLFEEGNKYDYNKVLLINQNGDFVGKATETEISIL